MMKPIAQLLVALGILLSLAFFCPDGKAQDKLIRRFVEFRDGSIISLPLVDQPWAISRVNDKGGIEKSFLKPSEISSVTLSAGSGFEKKQRLLADVQRLGAENFQVRETAWQSIVKLGPSIRKDLESCMNFANDVETRARLQALIDSMPKNPGKDETSQIAFDYFDTDRQFWGDLGEKTIALKWGQQIVRLPREAILSISKNSPLEEPVTSKRSRIGFGRIDSDDFPKNCTEINFEQDAFGQWLQFGLSVETTFLDKHCLISSPSSNKSVVIHAFNIPGRQEGSRYIGTQSPPQQGPISVRFVEPNAPQIPCAVSAFGCLVCGSSKGALKIVAYDCRGHEIGNTTTEQDQLEFVGIRSTIPMHKIEFLPVGKTANQYVLDDFKFELVKKPQASHPNRFLTFTKNRDIVFSQDVAIKDGRCIISGLSAGLSDLNLPANEIIEILPPSKLIKPQRAATTGLYVQLTDGSVLFAPDDEKSFGKPVFRHFPNLLQSVDDIATVWSANFRFQTPKVRQGQTAIWSPEEENWTPIGYLRLLEEVVLWKLPDGQFAASGYGSVPPITIRQAASGNTRSGWLIETTRGEQFFLQGNEKVSGVLSKQLTGSWRNQVLSWTADDIVSLRQVASPTTTK